MDNFCMSCHDANGATSPMSLQIQGFINRNALNAAGKTASPSNPFGDSISNRYDKMQRPAVTDVSDQFNTINNSQHGVKGPRYSGNSRFTGVDANGNARRQIASPGTFANNSSALLQGKRSTIYDAGNFNQLYIPLQDTGGEAAPRTGAKNLGDDSTLHCGDCHTVGQWKVGSSVNAAGQPTPAAIGAHGSNNEYLLRNSIGTDQRHTQNAFTLSATNVVTYTNPGGAFLVCYDCHAYTKYGSIYVQTGAGTGNSNQSHAGEYDVSGRCNGTSNTIPFNGYTTGTATDGTQFLSRFVGPIALHSSPAPYPGEQDPGGSTDAGDIFGIQCLNCHNSSVANAYGGIHGSAKNNGWKNMTSVGGVLSSTRSLVTDPSVKGGAYIDGRLFTTKIERFLPGLGNAMHVPGTLGGFTAGTTTNITNDTNWEQKYWLQTAGTVINNSNGVVTGALATSAGAGCYTLGTQPNTSANITAGLTGPSVTGQGGAGTSMYGTWGGCTDHTASEGAANHGFLKNIVRPVTY